MSSAILKGNSSGTGTVTLETPNTNSDRTISLPDAAGTMMVSGAMPAFSAYQSSTQILSNATYTKIQLQTEEFDTASAFDSTTNYRFTPQVAGYYQIQGVINYAGSASNIYTTALIYKNGTSFKRVQVYGAYDSGPIVVALVYLNGSSDYVELYGYQASGGTVGTTTGVINTYFQATMVRAA
jgi:hypothetical protein